MLLGVHDAMRGRQTGYAKIMPPSRWKQMSSAKRQKSLRDQLLSEIGSSTHMSASSVRNLYLCPISLLAKEFPEQFARTYNLDTDTLDILIHDPDTAQAIIKKIEYEKKQIEKELKKRRQEEERRNKTLKSSQTKKESAGKETSSLEASGQEAIISKIDECSDVPDKDKKTSQSTLFSF